MNVQEFIADRASGAAKIAKEARDKGGVATLTALHFEAKAPSYNAALVISRYSKPQAAILNDLKALERTAAAGVAAASSMLVFQQQTGKQEAYGEIIMFLEFGSGL